MFFKNIKTTIKKQKDEKNNKFENHVSVHCFHVTPSLIAEAAEDRA